VKYADHWFFVPDSSSKEVSFPSEEAVHAAKVLRLQVGDGIQWLNGKGVRYTGKITVIDKRSLIATVTSSGLGYPASERSAFWKRLIYAKSMKTAYLLIAILIWGYRPKKEIKR